MVWREVRGDAVREGALIANLAAATLPALLKQCLTADLLVGLSLACLRLCALGNAHAAAVLGALPGVARFSMIRMFIVGKDKAALTAAFDAAAVAPGVELSAARKAFGV